MAGLQNWKDGQGDDGHSRAIRSHIAPARDALEHMLEVSERLRDERGSIPDADSRAMAEIAEQATFAAEAPWGDDPVQAAHNSVGLLLFGSRDCALSMIRVLKGEPTPVYAHTVLARSALELAGRAWWLLDPDIGVRRRIARGMNERIFGLSAQGRLPLGKEEAATALSRRTDLFDIGTRLGFRKTPPEKGQPPMLDEKRPGQTEVIRRLMATDDDDRLGDVVYGLFSAVAHGTTFGLTESVTLNAPDLPKRPGLTWGAVYTGSGAVVVALSAVAIGLGQAIDRRNKHFHWQSVEWTKAWQATINAASRSMLRNP